MNVRLLLVTANVGSAFENPHSIQPLWIQEVLKTVDRHRPHFVAIHFQELGGKSFETTIDGVQDFAREIFESDVGSRYDRILGIFDESASTKETFTALGSLYLIERSLTDVYLWDFEKNRFDSAVGCRLYGGDLNGCTTHKKRKFPPDFFPQFKWSRKGYIQTRWRINGRVLDLVNVHLFHDASNLTAMEQSPSVYTFNRKKALNHVLKCVEETQSTPLPTFYFGDFNFRLDQKNVVKLLSDGLTPSVNQNDDEKVVQMAYYRNSSSDDAVLALLEKSFVYEDSGRMLHDNGRELRQFDLEGKQFDGLHELPLTFPPSYPYKEDLDEGSVLNTTRCPAWCDRILFNDAAQLDFMGDIQRHEYGMVGRHVCTGDHKPIYLAVNMPSNDDTDSGNEITSKRRDDGKCNYFNIFLALVAVSTLFVAVAWRRL
ncbi:inositol polyphosphate-5-phosphatase A-like [Oscarella lobularis]|uniref:inositol polyphosphate-5-phosphatase A-like n=1 Tax=Oscarella lobularis TaxID=121494 RepID=UPI003313C870